ncbi:hypothetical protein PSAL_028380 [Pseudooceanicola algae]|uniref:Uncharacterized protein n=1 Tax=Pseudooceanicola algae TaxID=1537215 RepID=A0A418SFZ0_9RHOB|nr:hypothetical protein PSAL_028380 [Pseudooceanicola algae]
MPKENVKSVGLHCLIGYLQEQVGRGMRPQEDKAT